MIDKPTNDSPIRIRYRVRETIYLEPMVVGQSSIDLKVEIYENENGKFTSSVFEKDTFLIEPAFFTGLPEDEDRRRMKSFYIEDEWYKTDGVCSSSVPEAIDATLKIIREQLLESGESIEYLSDFENE